MPDAIQLFPQGVRDRGGKDTNIWFLLEKCLKFIIGGNQHDFVRLAGALVARGHSSVRAGLDHFLCGLLGVLLVGWGEVVDGILYHVSRVYGLLQAAGDALHWGDVLCGKNTGTGSEAVNWSRIITRDCEVVALCP